MKRFGVLIVLGSLLAVQYGCGHRRTCCRCHTCYCAAPCVAQEQPHQPQPQQPEPVATEPTLAEEADVAFQLDDLELNQPVLQRGYY